MHVKYTLDFKDLEKKVKYIIILILPSEMITVYHMLGQIQYMIYILFPFFSDVGY